MKSSKKLAMLVTALTMSSSVALVAACQPTEEHTQHNYTWTQTTAPTCTEQGVETGTCECGETTTRPVDALGHDYEWSVTTDPTCTEAGEKTGVCKHDETHTTTEEVAATGHNYEWTVTTDPTCTEEGEKTGVCKNDKTHTTTESIAAIGHDYEWTETTAPTCTEAGEEAGVCKNDETHTTTREVPATGHTSGGVIEVIAAATCQDEGLVRVLCAVCNTEYTMTTPKTDHKWGEWIVDNEDALCTEETSRTHTCEICGEEESRVVPATEHRYADWHVTTAATCTEAGSREHTCVSCGHTESQVINATGHHYTDWQVANPTKDTAGVAKKVCAGDKELDHVITVNLPLLTDSSYKVEKDSETGVETYTLSNANGDITFKVYEINGVADAVDVAFKTQSQVIKATVNRDNDMVTDNGHQKSNREIVYELGVNYAHVIDDSERREYFYSLNDDGTLFPVMHSYVGDIETGDIKLVSKDTTATAESLNGYGYTFTFMMGGNKYYGTGSIINYLYTVGSNNTNKDFQQGIKTENGNTVYYFTYGMIYEKYFDVVYAEFSLDNSYIVSDAKLNVKTYVIKESAADPEIPITDPLLVQDETNGRWLYDGHVLLTAKGDYATLNAAGTAVIAEAYRDSDGTDKMRVKYTATFETLPNGTARVIKGMEDQWANSETYFISQKTQLDSGETLPTNPYNYEDFIISSFTLQKGGVEIEEGAEFKVNAKESVTLTINNVLPSTYNPYFDSFEVYLIDDMGNEIAAKDGVDIRDGEIGYHFFAGSNGVSVTKDYSITIKSFIAGEWDLKIVTAKHTFTVHLIVEYVAPDPIYAEVYQVNDVSGKETWNKTLTGTEVYENQAVTFRTAVDHPYYESSAANVTVTKDDENVTASCLTVSAVDGLPVYTFRGAEVGTYYITVTSKLSSLQSVTLTVTVKEAPDVSGLLDGSYSNDDLGYAVEFQPASAGALSGTAIITKGFPEDGADKLQTTTITYSYDPETRTFTSEYVSGAAGDFVQGVELPYNYSFELSEAYKLYLTYESGFDGSRVKVLIGGVQNSLVCSGANITAKSIEYADKLTANVSGTYKITATSSTFIAVNGKRINIKDGLLTDEEADYVTILPYITSSVTLDLYIGDYIQIWNGISEAPYYSIELVKEFKTVLVEGLEFNQESAEVREGETLVLAPVFTPENTTQRGLVWTTSDASIATVDENGIVTGVSAGTATITAKTSNGRYSATVEVTVIGANVLNLGENTLTFTTYTPNVEYVFEGEVGKTYTVNVTCDGNMGAQVTYNGAAYRAPIKLDVEGGTVKLIVSAYSYYQNNVVITISEKSDDPYADYTEITEGTHTIEIISGNEYYYKLVGEAYTQYKVEASYTSKWLVVNGVKDAESYESGALIVTTNADGFGYFITQTYDPTVTITITKGNKVEPEPEDPYADYTEITEGTHTIEIISGNEYYYKLVGDANTQYKIEALYTSKWLVVDGEKDAESFEGGALIVTTNADGLGFFITQTYDPTVTITVTKVNGGTVTPDPEPDPEPSDENVIEVGEDLVLENLDTTGVTLTLEGCEYGKTYQLIVYDADMETISSGVTVWVGDKQGNPVEFTYYGKMTGQVTVAAKNGTISELYVDLQEYEEEDEFDVLTVGEHTVKADAFYGPIYKLVVAEGEAWSVTSPDMSAYIIIGYGFADNGELEEGEDLDATNLTAGTYYIQIFADDMDAVAAVDCNFTVSKS